MTTDPIPATAPGLPKFWPGLPPVLARFARPLHNPSLPEAAAEAVLLLMLGAVATLALVAAGLAG